MKNLRFSYILNFALMAAIVAIFLFHGLIWPCGRSSGEIQGVTVQTVTKHDSTAHVVTTVEPRKPKAVTSNRPITREPAPERTVDIVRYDPSLMLPPSMRIDTTVAEIWLDEVDSVFINGVYYVPYSNEVAYYDTTVTEAEVSVQVEDSVSNSQILWSRYTIKNLRATQKNDVAIDMNDRFQLYFGVKLGGVTDWDGNQTRPMAGGEIAMKFKTNTMVDVGYMIGPDIQQVNIDLKQLIRFKKLGDAIRKRKAVRIANQLTSE